MAVRVDVEPALLEWACRRAGLGLDALSTRFPRLTAWLRRDAKPTLKQLEAFARATHAPVGYLLLPAPPVEVVPIPDLRTIGNDTIAHPSADLLDTVYQCQQRQQWYRDHARAVGDDPRPFVGSISITTSPEHAAGRIRSELGFGVEERRRLPTWTAALRRFAEQADALGVLVMVNGIVGNNTHRKLDPREFRGFALVDDLAPLVFVNGADTKAAQMFTLAHELAHLWLGQSALSDVGPRTRSSHDVEVWCNAVAAELLAPLSVIRAEYLPRDGLRANLDRLARHFKVSTLVVLRRFSDAGFLSRAKFRVAYDKELERVLGRRSGSGGSFYPTQSVRVGKRFASALIVSTLEGRTLYKEAFRLLGVSKVETFDNLAEYLGVT
ncbi:MAG: ImmA/IrrE family metallo-endopeptidase [Nannocystaceae bacterium]